MSSAHKLIKNESRKTHIPEDILEEVYNKAKKSPSPSTQSPKQKRAKAEKVLKEFIKNGCKFHMSHKYSQLAHRAQIGMSKKHVVEWCHRQSTS